MSNSSYRELKRNTIIIAISNLGSKAISFILAPLYSYFMTTAEYGTMDLITTSVVLLFPFICLDIFEASFRFASDDTYDKKIVLSSTLFVCIAENLIVWGILAIVSLFYKISLVVVICILSATLESIYQVLSQYSRGCGKMKTFAFSGIINSIVLLLLNVAFMVVLTLGLKGWIISFVCAKVVTVLYLTFSIGLLQDFRISFIRKEFLKEAINFCLPLMPSASMWWIMNVSDRYVISFASGVSATGIYAVANKLPAILSLFENVFYQSWQTTAINTMNNDDRDNIYSKVFYKYFRILTAGVLAILIFLKPLIIFLFAEDYHSAWISSSVLVIGVLVHALAGNLGTVYTVFKNTTGALKTSAIGAVSNLILNLIFVNLFGMNAAAWTTLVGYIIVLVIRWKDTKEKINIEIPKKEMLIFISLLVISLMFYYVDSIVSYIVRIIIFLVVTYMCKDCFANKFKRN